MQRWTQLQQQCEQSFMRLSVRERVLVMSTVLFVIVAALGSIIWSVHHAATREQQRVNELKDLMVWMQTNAASMKADQDSQLSAQDKIQRVAQQQGLSISSSQQGEQIQIVAVHAEYSVLANLLTQMAQIGLNLKKVNLIDESGQIKLTAVVE